MNEKDGLSSDPIVNQVIEKQVARSQAGIKKYGTTLAGNKLSTKEWLNHAQEEALDLANYLEVLISDKREKFDIEEIGEIIRSTFCDARRSEAEETALKIKDYLMKAGII